MRLIRWAQYASLGPGCSRRRRPTVKAVGVSHYDGSYVDTIECDQIPGYTRGPLKREFTLQIAGGRAQYARPLILPPTRLRRPALTPPSEAQARSLQLVKCP